MNSSRSSQKRDDSSTFRRVTPFDMFYQLTYMSAMASSGISRSKLFLIAAQSQCTASPYFHAINNLVEEVRYDYPEACRLVGTRSKSENMRTFLFRLADSLRSGEPLPEFLTREAEVQSDDYRNEYERNLENLKQWTNAFSSITISVGLIIIIQMITAMIYSTSVNTIAMLVLGGAMMSGFGVWIIFRSAPRELMNVTPSKGSEQQRRALRLFKIVVPVSVLVGALMALVSGSLGIALLSAGACLLPVGVISMMSDRVTNKKDVEFGTLLRSIGGIATSSGTTLKQALGRIELSSFPALEEDIQRLATRLVARIDPDICWRQFGLETGSRLISEVSSVFYGAVKIGGDPERVGYVCSLFVARSTQLRAKRRLVAGTFSALATVMHSMVTGLIVFVLAIVNSFSIMVEKLSAEQMDNSMNGEQMMSLGLAEFTPEDLARLGVIAIFMVLVVAVTSSSAVIVADGGLKLKFCFYLALTIFIAGVCFIAVPPLVAGILK
ncbi:MAG: archaellar assembly protein FlaJ [Chloroflexi bacterium]|nr:archaellar assembly protein FlaJ [Chloroflexota bacterium]